MKKVNLLGILIVAIGILNAKCGDNKGSSATTNTNNPECTIDSDCPSNYICNNNRCYLNQPACPPTHSTCANPMLISPGSGQYQQDCTGGLWVDRSTGAQLFASNSAAYFGINIPAGKQLIATATASPNEDIKRFYILCNTRTAGCNSNYSSSQTIGTMVGLSDSCCDSSNSFRVIAQNAAQSSASTLNITAKYTGMYVLRVEAWGECINLSVTIP